MIASSTTWSGYVRLRSAAGAGVKTRLHDAQHQSWTISILFLRVPFFATWVLPQCGQRSGRLSVCGTRYERSMGNGLRKMDGRDTEEVTDTGRWRGASARPYVA